MILFVFYLFNFYNLILILSYSNIIRYFKVQYMLGFRNNIIISLTKWISIYVFMLLNFYEQIFYLHLRPAVYFYNWKTEWLTYVILWKKSTHTNIVIILITFGCSFLVHRLENIILIRIFWNLSIFSLSSSNFSLVSSSMHFLSI